MSVLFESSEINGMRLANRFVRSATWTGKAAKEGACTPGILELIDRLVKGAVGLIVTGHAYVLPEGQAGPRQLGAYKDELVRGLRDLTQVVHDHGGRILLQISHAGRFAATELTNRAPLAPSEIQDLKGSPCQAMSIEDIKEVVGAFGQAALRAKEAGFDGVQLHAAHGYLLSQFVSPFFNRRADEYGGSLQKRMRALREILEGVRGAVGADFPVLVKMNCQGFIDGGHRLDESLQVGLMLQKGGINAIELSGGTPLSGKLSPVRMRINAEEKEAYFRREAKAFKETLEVPLILVGGIRSFHVAERLIREGFADYIAMCRPFIREPGLVKRWQAGDLRKATCVSDNRCLRAGQTEEGIYCVHEGEEKETKDSSQGEG